MARQDEQVIFIVNIFVLNSDINISGNVATAPI